MENQGDMFSTMGKKAFCKEGSGFLPCEKSIPMLRKDKGVPHVDQTGICDDSTNAAMLNVQSRTFFNATSDTESLQKPVPVYGHIMTSDQPQHVSLFCDKMSQSISDCQVSKAKIELDLWKDDLLKYTEHSDSAASNTCLDIATINSDEMLYSRHSNYFTCCHVDDNHLSHTYSNDSLDASQTYENFPYHSSKYNSFTSTTNLLTIASQRLFELVSSANSDNRPESISASSDAQSYHSFGNESLLHHETHHNSKDIHRGVPLIFSNDKATAVRSATTPVVFLCRPQESRVLLRMSVSLIKTYQIINEMYYSKKRRRTTEQISSDDSLHRDSKRFLNNCSCYNVDSIQPHKQCQCHSKRRHHHHHHRHSHHHHHSAKSIENTHDLSDLTVKRRHHKHGHSHHHYHHHHKHPNDILIDRTPVTDSCIPKCVHCSSNSTVAQEHLVKPGEVWMNRYSMDLLIGTGSFGQVVRANDLMTGEPVAIKIIRNRRSFVQQAETEIRLLRMLARYQEDQDFISMQHWGANCIVRLKSHFMYRGHLCLVFELLTYSLYELLKNTGFSGVSLNLTRKFGLQLVSALHFLSQPSLQIIHCDLKPENVLLVHPRRSAIKVVDFGSSCRLNERLYVYIQSRFYRAPEVLLYLPYSMAIDMWSLGCVLVELHTGHPLFVGQYEHEQILRIIEVVGMPPNHMITSSKRSNKYFMESNQQNESCEGSAIRYEPKVFRNRDGKKIPFEGVGARKLFNILGAETGGPDGRRKDEPGHSPADYACFIDLIERMLTIDPCKRITPDEALKHPFFCYTGRHTASLTSSVNNTSMRNSPS